MAIHGNGSRRHRTNLCMAPLRPPVPSVPHALRTGATAPGAEELRRERLLLLRDAIVAGTYHVDSLTIADRLLERLFSPYN